MRSKAYSAALQGLVTGQRGSIMVLTAVAMVVLLGFTALGVDGGYLYFRHTQLQDVADASALAAAGQLVSLQGSPEDMKQCAFDAVVRYAGRNGLIVSNASGYSADLALGDDKGRLEVTFAEDLSDLRVEINLDASLFFARALSLDAAPVGVASSAEVIHVRGETGGAGGALPLGLFQGNYVPGARYQMTLVPGGGCRGNYGFLDYGSTCMFSDYLAHGFDGVIKVGDVIETLPGVTTGQVRQGICERICGCTHGCSVTDLDGDNDGRNVNVDIEEPCPRVVMIPVITGFFEQCGRGRVTVSGFVKFFIEGYDQGTKILTGWCLGEVGARDTTGSLEIRGVRLTK